MTAKKGESIDSLARRYGVPAHEFRAANGAVKLNKKGVLAVNQSIMVPMKSATAVAAAAPAKATHAKNTAPATKADVVPASSGSTYIVRAGDTLYGIAQKAGATVDDILALNRLKSSAVIQPGLRLRLP